MEKITFRYQLGGGYYFAVNRIKKIYPIYIASLMVCIPYDFIRSLGIGHTTMETIRNIFIKIAFCVTLLQSVAGIEALDRGLNNVCWFLSSLFMIYIISPYMISMINKVKDRWISIIFAGTICATMLIFYFFTSIQEVTFFDDLNYGSPYFRIMFVILGMLLEKIYEHIKDNIRKYRCFEYLAAVGAVAWFFYRNQLKEYLYACRLIDILLCAFLLLTIASGNGKVAYFLSRKQSVMLGNTSMYIFIIHFPIILYLDYLFDRSNIRVFLNDATGIVEAILIIVSTGVIVRIMKKKRREVIF